MSREGLVLFGYAVSGVTGSSALPHWRDRFAGLPSVNREDQTDLVTATRLQMYGVPFDTIPVAQIIVEAAGVLATLQRSRPEPLWSRPRRVARAGTAEGALALEAGPRDDLRRAELAEKIVEVTNRRGRPTSCKVTCTPLMSEGRHVQGVMLMIDEAEV